jgi:hypothetical protein
LQAYVDWILTRQRREAGGRGALGDAAVGVRLAASVPNNRSGDDLPAINHDLDKFVALRMTALTLDERVPCCRAPGREGE